MLAFYRSKALFQQVLVTNINDLPNQQIQNFLTFLHQISLFWRSLKIFQKNYMLQIKKEHAT